MLGRRTDQNIPEKTRAEQNGVGRNNECVDDSGGKVLLRTENTSKAEDDSENASSEVFFNFAR